METFLIVLKPMKTFRGIFTLPLVRTVTISNLSQLSQNQMSAASSSSDPVRPPRRQTKPMSLMYDDDDVQEKEEEVTAVDDDEVQIVSVKPPPFNPDQWILNLPEMNSLAEELVGKKSKAHDKEGKDYGSPMWSYNEMKGRGNASNALRQLISSATTVLSFNGDSRRKSYDHDVAQSHVTKRIIRVLCDRIISLERKRTEPLALILRDKYLFGKAKRSWNKSVASTAAASPSASACSPSNGNANISPTRTQIADIRARRFQRGAAAGAGAGGACDQ